MPYNPMAPAAGGMMPGGVARPQGMLPMQSPQFNPGAMRSPQFNPGAMQSPQFNPGAMQSPQRPMQPLMPMQQPIQPGSGQMAQRPMQPQMNTQQMALRALVQQHSADAMRQQALARAAMGQLPNGNRNMGQRPTMPQGQMPMQRPMMPQAQPQGSTIPLGTQMQRPTTPNPLLGINPQLQSRLRSVLGV